MFPWLYNARRTCEKQLRIMVPSFQLLLNNAVCNHSICIITRVDMFMPFEVCPSNRDKTWNCIVIHHQWTPGILALVNRAFCNVAEKVLYSTITLDSQHANTIACLETLRSNAHKAALVESMGIIFSGAGLLPLNLLEELGFVIHNTTELRHLDLDWICPNNMDDPGLQIVNSILTFVIDYLNNLSSTDC